MRQADLAPQFSDGKASDAMRTIGEVSRALQVKPHVLRYWEQQFPMLKPLKRSGNRRLYRPEDIALLVRIDRLVHQQGYTIKGARAALQGGQNDAMQAVPSAAPTTDRGPAPILPQLRAIRDRLASALAA